VYVVYIEEIIIHKSNFEKKNTQTKFIIYC